MIIREAYAQGSADLKYAGIESPALDASILLAHVLKTTRTALVAAGMEKISAKDCAVYCNLIERRCSGECVAYITGKKEFMGLEFEVNPSVLVPRPETEILVEAAIDVTFAETSNLRFARRKEKIRCLDLCTGSGAVAIALKHEIPELEVYATDISVEALETAKRNAARLLPGNDICFLYGDLYNALITSQKSSSPPFSLLPSPFNVILSNPPYIPTHEINTLSAEVRGEPRIALDGGESGLDIIKRIIDGASEYLCKGGLLLLEADPRQMNDITAMLEKNGFIDIKLYKDLSGLNRVIGGVCSE